MSLIKYYRDPIIQDTEGQDMNLDHIQLYFSIILKCVWTKLNTQQHVQSEGSSQMYNVSLRGHCISINAGQDSVTFLEAILIPTVISCALFDVHRSHV